MALSEMAYLDASAASDGFEHDVHQSALGGRVVPLDGSYFRYKAVLEQALAAVLLGLALPVIAALILIIRLSSPGPAIYCQVRVGRAGRRFTMYKLRSMRSDAESATGPVWALDGKDPRVTVLGHWLRVLHLDELPQLYNIVRGEMSLVGPRPERPEFVSILAAEIPGYLDRLRVMPGITGLAQINLPPDTDRDSVRRKLVLDKEYIATAGALLDLRIFASTLLRLVGLRGGRAVSVFGLKRVVELPLPVASAESGTTTVVVSISRKTIVDPPVAARREMRAVSESPAAEACHAAELTEAESCAS